jgi:hypothetical protein
VLKEAVTRALVSDFLKRFKKIAAEDHVIFVDRKSWKETLTWLRITPHQANEEVMALEVSDYYKGNPYNADPNGKETCEFGQTVLNEEVYIKLQIDKRHNKAICMSFHIPKWPMKYPLQRGGEEITK